MAPWIDDKDDLIMMRQFDVLKLSEPIYQGLTRAGLQVHYKQNRQATPRQAHRVSLLEIFAC